jgi:hypothetical protein
VRQKAFRTRQVRSFERHGMRDFRWDLSST